MVVRTRLRSILTADRLLPRVSGRRAAISFGAPWNGEHGLKAKEKYDAETGGDPG